MVRNSSRALHVLISGASRGLGRATAIELCRAGHHVLGTARTPAKAQATRAAVHDQLSQPDFECMPVELGSAAEIRNFATALLATGRRFDVLHHNAGILVAAKARSMSVDDVETTLAVNAVAPLLLTRLLLPAMRRPGRVTATASGLHLPGQRGDEVDFRFDDPQLDTRYTQDRAYKNSKLALQWVIHALDRRLAPQDIRVDGICPGFIPETAAQHFTGWQRFFLGQVLKHAPFATKLKDAAQRMAHMLTDESMATGGGRFFQHWEPAQDSEQARDPDFAERFYVMACAWVGLEPDVSMD